MTEVNGQGTCYRGYSEQLQKVVIFLTPELLTLP